MFDKMIFKVSPYLADDVNKVFAKVSRKISRVKMERFVTN